MKGLSDAQLSHGHPRNPAPCASVKKYQSNSTFDQTKKLQDAISEYYLLKGNHPSKEWLHEYDTHLPIVLDNLLFDTSAGL